MVGAMQRQAPWAPPPCPCNSIQRPLFSSSPSGVAPRPTRQPDGDATSAWPRRRRLGRKVRKSQGALPPRRGTQAEQPPLSVQRSPQGPAPDGRRHCRAAVASGQGLPTDPSWPDRCHRLPSPLPSRRTLPGRYCGRHSSTGTGSPHPSPSLGATATSQSSSAGA